MRRLVISRASERRRCTEVIERLSGCGWRVSAAGGRTPHATPMVSIAGNRCGWKMLCVHKSRTRKHIPGTSSAERGFLMSDFGLSQAMDLELTSGCVPKLLGACVLLFLLGLLLCVGLGLEQTDTSQPDPAVLDHALSMHPRGHDHDQTTLKDLMTNTTAAVFEGQRPTIGQEQGGKSRERLEKEGAGTALSKISLRTRSSTRHLRSSHPSVPATIPSNFRFKCCMRRNGGTGTPSWNEAQMMSQGRCPRSVQLYRVYHPDKEGLRQSQFKLCFKAASVEQ